MNMTVAELRPSTGDGGQNPNSISLVPGASFAVLVPVAKLLGIQ